MRFLIFTLVFLLSGCGIDSAFETPQKLACPSYGVLKSAAQIEKDGLSLRLQRLAGECVEQDGDVQMTLGVLIETVREKVETPLPQDMRYFAVVLDEAGQVVAKQSVAVEVEFSDSALAANSADILDLTLPAEKNWSVLVGFEEHLEQGSHHE